MISAVITMENDSVLINESKVVRVDDTFQPNFYETWVDSYGKRYINIKRVDEVHEPFVTKQNLSALESIKAFFQDGMLEKVNQLGFTHKLGVLLFGKQGTGKTSLINYVVSMMVKEKGAVVFFCNNGSTLDGAISLAKEIRKIQNSPIIFVADEFERYAEKYEADMKNLLDGNDSINNSLFLAATNYIDKVPNTLKDRPSRFRVVLEITGVDDKVLIKKMIKTISDKIQPSLFVESEIDDIVKDIDMITLDEVKHICLNKITNIMLPSKLNSPIGLVHGLAGINTNKETNKAEEILLELLKISGDVKISEVVDKIREKAAEQNIDEELIGHEEEPLSINEVVGKAYNIDNSSSDICSE